MVIFYVVVIVVTSFSCYVRTVSFYMVLYSTCETCDNFVCTISAKIPFFIECPTHNSSSAFFLVLICDVIVWISSCLHLNLLVMTCQLVSLFHLFVCSLIISIIYCIHIPSWLLLGNTLFTMSRALWSLLISSLTPIYPVSIKHNWEGKLLSLKN